MSSAAMPKGMKPTKVIAPPTELGNGRKLYVVNGAKFEVPVHIDVSKAIGFGAYGIVCSALDHSQGGVKVAIKKCSNVFKDPGDCKRVLREVKLLRFLQHENTLQLRNFYVGDTKENFSDVYLVSDLLDTDLNTVIRSKQRISTEHMKYFVYQMLRALKYIHSARVVHRDIKPANVLINLNCDLRLCDFGLARGLDAQLKPDPPEMTDYVVTRWYRPPELLLMNKHYDTAVDIWSVGCIFAEMANRHTLFPGRDYLAQVSMICDTLSVPESDQLQSFENKEAVRYIQNLERRTPKPIRELIPDIDDPHAHDFLGKMLVFDPKMRSSAEELMAHPYLAQLHDPTDEPISPAPFRWKYDAVETLTREELRELFWEEVLAFSPINVPSTQQQQQLLAPAKEKESVDDTV